MPLRKTLHKLASPLLYQTGLYRHYWRSQSRREPFSFVVVYHRVVPDGLDNSDQFAIERGISASEFERQMQFLRRHFIPVRASQVQQSLNRDIRFAVTLDDGYEDNYRIAAPILKKLGIPATFYVVSDYVATDRLFWWEQVAEILRGSSRRELDWQAVFPGHDSSDLAPGPMPLNGDDHRHRAYERLCAAIRHGLHANIPGHMQNLAEYFDVPLREQGRRYGLMNWEQLRDLVGQGFEIGGHTASHCNVVGMDEDRLRDELVESIRHIEVELDSPVESFAYPYGIFAGSNRTIAKLLAQTSCKTAFTTVQGVVKSGLPAIELPRTRLNRAYHFACAFNLQDTLYQAGPDRGSTV